MDQFCAVCPLASHGALLYLLILLLICAPSRGNQPHILLPNHVLFWLLIITLFWLQLATSAAHYLIGSAYLDILTPILGICTLAAEGVWYQFVESGGKDSLWLVPVIVYNLSLSALLCFSWVQKGEVPPLESFIFQLDAGLVIISLAISVILIHAVFKDHRRSSRRFQSEFGAEDLAGDEIVYTHDTSPLLSRLTFFWFTGLLNVGFHTPLEDSHLGTLPPSHTTATQLDRFKKGKAEAKGKQLRLWPLLWGVVGANMALGGVFRLLADMAGFVAPLGIRTIVRWSGRRSNLTGEQETLEESTFTLDDFLGNGYIMVGVVLLASLLQATFSQCSTYLVNTEGLHVKAALQGLIYEKSVRVAGRGEETGNLIGEDANNVMMLFWMAHFVWAIPLKLAVLMALLWGTLGWSALIAAALCILIMLPLQFIIAKAMASNSKQLLERGDERLGWTGEIVSNMRLLKAHAWELAFGDRLKEMRNGELKHLDNDLLYRSLMTFLTHMSTVVVTVVTFGLYPVMEEGRLEPSAVFAGLALFNQLTVPLFIFPITVPVLIDAFVSGRRIADFLNLPEMHSDCLGDANDEGPLNKNKKISRSTNFEGSSDSVFVLENIAEDEEEDQEEQGQNHNLSIGGGGGNIILRLDDASFSWDGEQSSNLSNVSLEVKKDQLTVIVGPTGSGKSSLLSAILGEVNLTNGSLCWSSGRRSQIAYAAQTPWILNGTVRENIVFGRGFKGRRYKRVLQAVSLEQDLDVLPEGDGTEIGDHGVNLSGGQRQRICIARSLYSTAPLVVLDDPLSALDVEVAAHVLDVGIRKLLARRTVILVTHHLPVLPHAHHIVAMEGGRIRIQGSLSEIKKKDPELASHWDDLISTKEAELARMLEAKTAKDRWTLLKLVSKIGFRVKRRDPEDNPTPQHFRSRKGTFSHYKNLSHDFFLPSDECHEELFTHPIVRSRRPRNSRGSRTSASSAKHQHVTLQRMSSLQPPENGGSKNPNFIRLQSMPAAEDEGHHHPPISPVRRFRSENNRVPNETFFRRMFNSSSNKKLPVTSTGSSEPEPTTPVPPVPPMGSIQSEGELTEDDPQENLLVSTLEEREYGSVPLRVYLIYAKACGHMLSTSYLIFAIGYEVVRVLTSFWLSRWSDTVAQEEDEAAYDSQMNYFFLGYVLLSVATVAVSLTCNLLGKAAGARSRRLLHDNFISHLMDAPLSFFESTPIGRILGRASSDVAVVDRKLVISVQRFFQFLFLCLSAVVVNGVVNPWFLLLALPLIAIYYVIQKFYRISSRELQRIQAISRGPILSHFHETLQGLSTIRAYGRQKAFTEHMFACIDLNNRADMFINVGNRWLSISLDYLGSVIVAVCSLGAVVSADLGLVTPSVVGLAINYTLLVPVYLNWVVKFMAEVEMFMNSVDRLDRYSRIEREENETRSLVSLPPSWPQKGDVEFEKVSISYEDYPPIIQNLSLSIQGGQKVGFCGRSGCGKSSLLSSLFRLSGQIQGRILIDGVDIQSLSHRTLRSALCIIPQHSALFTAPLRFNLDPGGKCSDLELWEALELSQMKEIVIQLPNQLDEIMSPDSFSAGQRQLIALAIALLHKSRLVVMDEATSSVDGDTEATLLGVVSKQFADCTVLSIAHRLGTIVDGDRVVVLEEGKVVEDGTPSKLLSKRPRSIFANMLKADNNMKP